MTAAIVLLLFGVVTSWLSLQIQVGTLRAPGSGFFPFYLGLLLIVLAVVHMGQLRRQGSPRFEKAGVRQGSRQRVALFLGAMLLATGLLTAVGYAVTAFLLMALLLCILGVRRWLEVVMVAGAAAAVSYLLFVRWLQIPLPSGWFVS